MITETISIEDVQIKKVEAEDKIRNILQEFYDETGLTITEIEHNYLVNSSRCGVQINVGKVSCKVRI